MAEELLGGGLDIDGWNFIKQETTRSIQEISDKNYVHRQMVPIVMKTTMRKDDFKETKDIVVGALESKSHIDPPWLAEKIKRGLDRFFGASWHVVVGEEFTFNIDFESNLMFYMLYGNVGIVGWKCGAMLASNINHFADPDTKEKLKAMMFKRKDEEAEEDEIRSSRKNAREYFSEKI